MTNEHHPSPQGSLRARLSFGLGGRVFFDGSVWGFSSRTLPLHLVPDPAWEPRDPVEQIADNEHPCPVRQDEPCSREEVSGLRQDHHRIPASPYEDAGLGLMGDRIADEVPSSSPRSGSTGASERASRSAHRGVRSVLNNTA